MSCIPKKPLSQIDLTSISQFLLTPQEEEHLNRGILLFNAGKFWEAHEVWEAIWQQRAEDARFFIQGLIQLAAAYHQLGRRIYRGVFIHLRQAEERLRLFPPDFLGINVGELLNVLRESLKAIDRYPTPEGADFPSITAAKIRRRGTGEERTPDQASWGDWSG